MFEDLSPSVISELADLKMGPAEGKGMFFLS
jgi:hypothetical protein